MGYSFIVFVIILLVINIYFVVKEMFKLFRLNLIKRWNLKNSIKRQEQHIEANDLKRFKKILKQFSSKQMSIKVESDFN